MKESFTSQVLRRLMRPEDLKVGMNGNIYWIVLNDDLAKCVTAKSPSLCGFFPRRKCSTVVLQHLSSASEFLISFRNLISCVIEKNVGQTPGSVEFSSEQKCQ